MLRDYGASSNITRKPTMRISKSPVSLLLTFHPQHKQEVDNCILKHNGINGSDTSARTPHPSKSNNRMSCAKFKSSTWLAWPMSAGPVNHPISINPRPNNRSLHYAPAIPRYGDPRRTRRLHNRRGQNQRQSKCGDTQKRTIPGLRLRLGIRVIPGNRNRGRQLLLGSEQYGVSR